MILCFIQKLYHLQRRFFGWQDFPVTCWLFTSIKPIEICVVVHHGAFISSTA